MPRDVRLRPGQGTGHDHDQLAEQLPPGKRTLTQALRPVPAFEARGGEPVDPIAIRIGGAPAPEGARYEDPLDPHVGGVVQASGELDGPSVHAVAERGMSGRGGALPHASTIQASFGHHDLSDVRAHVDDAAMSANAELGARAYASGDAIAFGGVPDLRLAAHEAAHVVQQRGGVRLDAGVGRRGDTYELHADAVADLVVRGDSAEALLDTMAHRGAAGGRAVQRDEYVGAHESLSSTTAGEMSDDQLQETSAGTLGALGAGPDAGALENRELVRHEMARRGIDATPPATPAQSFTAGGIVWGDDPAFIRWQVEQLFSERLGRTPSDARDQIVRHLTRLSAGADRRAPTMRVAPDPSAETEIILVRSVLAQVDAQIAAVQSELATFLTEFQTSAHQLGLQILDESEQRITSELARYGIAGEPVRDPHTMRAPSSPADAPEAIAQRQQMMAAAGDIAASERRVRTLRGRRDLVAERLATAEACATPEASDPDMDADIDGMGTAPTLYDVCQAEPTDLVGSAPQLRDLLASLDRALAGLQEEHATLRAEKEGEFPVIATYTSGETVDLAGLDRLATATSTAAIAEDARTKLDNIREVRAALGDDLSIYELPQLLELAKARFNVAPGSPRDVAIRHELDERADASFWRSIGIMVLSIGLGVLAAIPTGGASLAVTGTVLAAEVAGLALDAYLLYQSVEEYEVRGALANTDFDRARVLAHDEPSLFWLAVDILGVGIGLAGATSTFRQAARVRRAVLAARNADEAAEQLLELRRMHAGGQLTAEEQVLVKQMA